MRKTLILIASTYIHSTYSMPHTRTIIREVLQQNGVQTAMIVPILKIPQAVMVALPSSCDCSWFPLPLGLFMETPEESFPFSHSVGTGTPVFVLGPIFNTEPISSAVMALFDFLAFFSGINFGKLHFSRKISSLFEISLLWP